MPKHNKTQPKLPNLFSSLIKVYHFCGGLVGLILFSAAIAVIYSGYILWTDYNSIESTAVSETFTTMPIDQFMKLPKEELLKLIRIDLEGLYDFPEPTAPVDPLMTLPVDQLIDLPKEELLKLIWIDIERFYNLYINLDTADTEIVRRSSYLDHTFTKLMIPTSEDILINSLLNLVEIFDRVQTSGATEEDILSMRGRGKVIEYLMLHHDPSLKGYLSRVPEFDALLSPELIPSDARKAATRKAVSELHAEINATYHWTKQDLLEFEDLFINPGTPEFNKTFSLSESNPLEASKKIMEERYGKNWEDPKNKDCRLYSNRGNNSGEWFPWVVVGAGVITVLFSLVSLFGGGACCSTTSC